AWNVFGILDLMIAVGTGFLTAPSLLVPFESQPTSELMTILPMVMIPVYLVPLSIVLHLASLAKLRREAVAGNGFGRAVAAHWQSLSECRQAQPLAECRLCTRRCRRPRFG